MFNYSISNQSQMQCTHVVQTSICVCFRLFLLKSDLQWSEEEADILGQGGSGTIIYRAKYRGHPVAIKRFHFKKCRQQSLNSSTGTLLSCTDPCSSSESSHYYL